MNIQYGIIVRDILGTAAATRVPALLRGQSTTNQLIINIIKWSKCGETYSMQTSQNRATYSQLNTSLDNFLRSTQCHSAIAMWPSLGQGHPSFHTSLPIHYITCAPLHAHKLCWEIIKIPLLSQILMASNQAIACMFYQTLITSKNPSKISIASYKHKRPGHITQSIYKDF